MMQPVGPARSLLNSCGDVRSCRCSARPSPPTRATRAMASAASSVARGARSVCLMAGFAALSATAVVPQPGHAAPIVPNGYTFTQFYLPNSGNVAGARTNINGIANNGATVGFAIGDDGVFTNYIRNADGTTTQLNFKQQFSMRLSRSRATGVSPECNSRQ
jgi:hypothetical protein